MSPHALLHDILDCTANLWPNKTGIRTHDGSASYEWIQRESRLVAEWLTRRGVRRGCRVVIQIEPCKYISPLIYGCSRIGAMFCVIPTDLPERILQHVLADAEPSLVVSDLEATRTLAARMKFDHSSSDELRSWSERIPADPGYIRPLSVDGVCLVYTSGTTHLPKAVVSTHAQVTFAVAAIQSQLQYKMEDVVLGVLPLSFDYGLYQIFLATFSGATLELLSPNVGGSALLGSLMRSRATVLPAVPSLLVTLSRLLGRKGPKQLSSLRLITSTGSALSESLHAEITEMLPHTALRAMYGLTECKRATIMPESHRGVATSCGLALPDTEVYSVDRSDNRLGPGEVGELVVRGPHVMAGYWRAPELTATRFRHRDGVVRELYTGDLGWLDGSNFVHVLGRIDGIYKQSGYRIGVAEVEYAAFQIEGLVAAAVVPRNEEEGGSVLFFQVADGFQVDVANELRKHLEPGKLPRRYVSVDTLPTNANGKIDRDALSKWQVDGNATT